VDLDKRVILWNPVCARRSHTTLLPKPSGCGIPTVEIMEYNGVGEKSSISEPSESAYHGTQWARGEQLNYGIQ